MRRPSLLGFTAALLAAAALPAAAVADGLPLYGVDVGNIGVGTRDGASRYVTLPAWRSHRRRACRAGWGPRCGSADLGWSLHHPGCGLRTTVGLAGDFSFDAISPDGETLYLVKYLSPRVPTRYAVRAYDLSAGRLLPKPIVDPTEPDERMGGRPVTRAPSSDGRWAYTLYERNSQHPFIHALDTVARTARCIDLDLAPGVLGGTRLQVSPGGGTIRLVRSGAALADVDTATFESISYPPGTAAPAETKDRSRQAPTSTRR